SSASASSGSGGAGGEAGTGGTGGTGGAGGAGGTGGGGTGGGMVDPCSTGCPTGTWDIDGNPLTGEQCGCEYQCTLVSADSDPIDDQYKDDNCDGTDGVAEQCIYVSVGAGSDASAGTRQEPMKTIAAAIQQAQAKGVPSVCLSGEIYNEAVTVVSGISIYGGFDHNNADFRFRRTSAVTTTVKAVGTVFYAPQIDKDTHIEGISIEAATPQGASESTYGVRLGGGVGQLYVRYNKMVIGNANSGDVGGNGMAHAQSQAPNGINGTNGAAENNNSGIGGAAQVCDAPGGKGGDGGANSSAGQNGSPGNGGAPGGQGSSANSCTPGIGGAGPAGGTGQNGDPSSQGAAGLGGNALGSVMASLYVPAHGSDGANAQTAKGGGGGGGGGGGKGDGLCFGEWDKGGGGGSGGCGGKGGNGGKGGKGGGGSFGVFAASGKVTVSKNEIQTGAGGNGGLGGNGALGQTGGIGGNGGGNSDDSGPGGKGGNGGKGSAGGPGGGGGGGPSACLARASGVMFTYEGNSCSTGAVGLGANGGTNPEGGVGGKGQNGTSGLNIQIN
ncbi:PE-PGRS family protein, partial [Polyangium sp. 15x6]|uniref:PE-PGRS family protein n=1 Tax=Polyangium sp. 15x6 TaxID=3042687 RepID=UPI00249A0CFF